MVALLGRGFDFKVMDLESVLAPVAALTAVLTLVVWRVARDPNDRRWKLLVLVPFLAAYGYGALMEANGLFDSSRPILYKVSVSRRLYEQTKVDDTVHIGVRSGYFNIAWYYVRP